MSTNEKDFKPSFYLDASMKHSRDNIDKPTVKYYSQKIIAEWASSYSARLKLSKHKFNRLEHVGGKC